MFTKDQVKHIAQLARLGLSDEEISKFSAQLSSILDYVAQLEEVDVKNVEPTSQVTGLKNVLRKDKVESFCTREELLGCTELPVVQDQIKVQAAITH